MAGQCECSTLKDELIRDRTVVGVIDDDLSNDLQARAKLTLTEAVQICRQTEGRTQSQPIIQGSDKAEFVHKRSFSIYKFKTSWRNQTKTIWTLQMLWQRITQA